MTWDEARGVEDRHGDHWMPQPNWMWVRVEAPHEVREWDRLNRDYGPARRGHGSECLWGKLKDGRR